GAYPRAACSSRRLSGDGPRVSDLVQLCGFFRARRLTFAVLPAHLSRPAAEAPPLSATGLARCHVLLSAPWLVLQLSSEARPNCAPLSRLPLWRVAGAGRLLCD